MNFVKKITRIFLSLFLVSFLHFSFADGDLDDLEWLLDDGNVVVGNILDNTEFSIVRNSDAGALIELFLSAGADKILLEDIFLRTNPFVKRSLLDNSLFLMDKNYNDGKWVLGVSLFFDQSSRMYFSGKSSCIQSYLALTKKTLISAINEVTNFFPSSDFDIEKVLALFKNATAQERRAGLFFSFLGQIKRVDFRFKIPFYYRERNFFLTDEERKAIENEFGKSDPAEGLKFARKHLISDQLGLGDLRFEFDFPIGTSSAGVDFRLGMFTTIPTGVAVVKGLYGEVFRPKRCRPKISFEEIFELAQETDIRGQAVEIARKFVLNALDGISSILLDTSLGNGRHYGLGILFKSDAPLRPIIDRSWTENIFFKNRISVEYLFPKTHPRWYIEKNDPSIFDEREFIVDESDPDKEEKDKDNLAFLEKMFVDKFYPYVYDTKVSPGAIFMWVSKLTYEGRRWGIHIGSDLWVKSKEKLCEICAPASQISLLDVQRATRPWSYQWSLFGSLFFKTERRKSNLYIGLNAEKTVASRGIGKPFKVTLSFERNF